MPPFWILRGSSCCGWPICRSAQQEIESKGALQHGKGLALGGCAICYPPTRAGIQGTRTRTLHSMVPQAALTRGPYFLTPPDELLSPAGRSLGEPACRHVRSVCALRAYATRTLHSMVLRLQGTPLELRLLSPVVRTSSRHQTSCSRRQVAPSVKLHACMHVRSVCALQTAVNGQGLSRHIRQQLNRGHMRHIKERQKQACVCAAASWWWPLWALLAAFYTD